MTFNFKYSSMRRLILSIFVIFLTFSCSQRLSLSQISTRNIRVNSQTSTVDSLVQSVITPYRDSIESDMSKLVAVSASPLKKGKPESELTDLVADILLESGTEYCKTNHLNIIPEISYVNYGGLRASLPQGNITVGNLFELMPFENEIVIIKISGNAVRQMADQIAARGGEGISGFKLGIRNEKAGKLTINGKDVDPEAFYWLVTNDYVANGGDQMSMFANPADRIDTKLKIRDDLITVLGNRYKKSGIITVKEDGRIYNEY